MSAGTIRLRVIGEHRRSGTDRHSGSVGSAASRAGSHRQTCVPGGEASPRRVGQMRTRRCPSAPLSRGSVSAWRGHRLRAAASETTSAPTTSSTSPVAPIGRVSNGGPAVQAFAEQYPADHGKPDPTSQPGLGGPRPGDAQRWPGEHRRRDPERHRRSGVRTAAQFRSKRVAEITARKREHRRNDCGRYSAVVTSNEECSHRPRTCRVGQRRRRVAQPTLTVCRQRSDADPNCNGNRKTDSEAWASDRRRQPAHRLRDGHHAHGTHTNTDDRGLPPFGKPGDTNAPTPHPTSTGTTPGSMYRNRRLDNPRTSRSPPRLAVAAPDSAILTRQADGDG